eukprot:CAMPEP_0204212606 /NCGR_PEP_ID=MMETSP0361-20130328/75364_1 /ASSEMBLY_ACC=CAM_ASM_000343 /TAXON_ID=268821 /ORGANISM="Scrippsiella Hangoei, Strain SHTV-5" /LENGTH=277 /DNA_ID=CAMNT_0051176955 /DNA_START=24 /DNA_END=855 /DNA_ORIENTATION=+
MGRPDKSTLTQLGTQQECVSKLLHSRTVHTQSHHARDLCHETAVGLPVQAGLPAREIGNGKRKAVQRRLHDHDVKLHLVAALNTREGVLNGGCGDRAEADAAQVYISLCWVILAFNGRLLQALEALDLCLDVLPRRPEDLEKDALRKAWVVPIQGSVASRDQQAPHIAGVDRHVRRPGGNGLQDPCVVRESAIHDGLCARVRECLRNLPWGKRRACENLIGALQERVIPEVNQADCNNRVALVSQVSGRWSTTSPRNADEALATPSKLNWLTLEKAL